MPFTTGGFGDVYKGTFDNSAVCIKRIRVTIRDVQEKAKVLFSHLAFLVRGHQPNPGLLQRSRNMEILRSPKRLTPSRYYHRSLATCFEVGVRRKYAGLYQKVSRCG